MKLLFKDMSEIKLDKDNNVRYGKFFFKKRMNQAQIFAYLLYATEVKQLNIKDYVKTNN